jgi:hypothetical protein
MFFRFTQKIENFDRGQADARPGARAGASHSCISLSGTVGREAGRSSTTGLPWRVMTTSSPCKARSISLGSVFFASATL